ncbi:MAG: serine hydrolase domain-containing protein [Rikenellaceae bacterium]
MDKIQEFFKEFFIVLYKIGLIIYKIILLLAKKIYRWLRTFDYSKLRNLTKRAFVIKYKYIILAILVLFPLLITVVASKSPIGFGGNKTINNVITNEMSDLMETKRLDRNIENFMRRWEIVGASLAIMKNDKLIYCKGYGYADKDREEACDVKHIFRLASVSKLITATAIMKLSEEGKLSLNDKVFGEEGILNDSRFLDIKDKRVKSITVENLLRHDAGFSTRSGDPMFDTKLIATKLDKKAPFTMDDVVEFASKSSLRFPPGKGYNYSNLGYVVLSKVIEKVTGEEYESYVKKEIFAPIGCFDIHIANNNSKDKFDNEVRYYEPSNEVQFEDEDGNLIPKSDGGNDVRLLGGAGGWVGSPAEILKFAASIDGLPGVEDIISPKSVRYMTVPPKGKKPIGWIRTNGDEWWRTGSMSGTSAMIKRQSNGYTWMLVTNTSSWKGARFPSQINASMKKGLDRVNEWPKHDIFEIADSIMGR